MIKLIPTTFREYVERTWFYGILTSVLILIPCMYIKFKRYDMDDYKTSASGKITSVYSTEVNSFPVERVGVSYKYNNVEYNETYESQTSYSVGDSVTVWFNSKNPSIIVLKRNVETVDALINALIGMSLIVALSYVFLYFYTKWRYP